MDSSKVFGGAEECHSSESGWTMYIGDDDDGDDGDYGATDDDDDDDGSGDDMRNANNHEDNESDDSMASDASSGPSHHYGTGEARDFKPNKEADEGTGSDKKAKSRMEKQKAEMKREAEKDQQEVMFMPKRVSAPAQSDSKVRKNVWNMTKRK